MNDTGADRIRRLREEKGWSQEELALAAQVSPRTIRRIEGRRPMSLETRKAVAAAFEIDAAELLDAPAKAAPAESSGSVPGHMKNGYTLLHALYGHERFHTLLDDTQHETTADLIKAVLAAIDTAKRWDSMSYAERYDAQRGLSAVLTSLWDRGWSVFCLPRRDAVALCVIDEKPRAKATLGNPQQLEQEAERMGISRGELIEFLDQLIDGERITLLAEIARRLGTTPEELSKAMGSTAESFGDPDTWSKSLDRAAASIGIQPEQLLLGLHELLEWMWDYTKFKETNGLLPKPRTIEGPRRLPAP